MKSFISAAATIASVAALCGSLGAYAQADCSGVAPWQTGGVYTSGMAVTFNNTKYRAKWWTNNSPATHSGPWQEWSNEGACGKAPISWRSFEKDPLLLYPWEGTNIALLSRNADLNEQSVNKLLGTLDQAYDFYKATVGFTPRPYILHNQKLAIADVPRTCGAGCGYIGYTGIELLNNWFDITYNAVHLNNQYDQVLFYELGRNFWVEELDKKLAYKAPDAAAPVVTGFAVFMRYLTMTSLQLPLAPVGTTPLQNFFSEQEALVDRYVADPSLTWHNTLKIDKAPANSLGLGGADLYTSFLMRLQRDYGGYTFVRRFWTEAANRPVATSTQDAVDNFFLAACAASNRNLTNLFTVQWRWPISSAAIANAGIYQQ